MNPNIDDITVGLLLISDRFTDATFFCPEKIAVVIKFPTLADAFIVLFALMYALHLSYTK